jgi:hypothetical protein
MLPQQDMHAKGLNADRGQKKGESCILANVEAFLILM